MNKGSANQRQNILLISSGECKLLTSIIGKIFRAALGDVMEVFLLTEEEQSIALRYLSGTGTSPFDVREEIIRLAVSIAEWSEIESILDSRYLTKKYLRGRISRLEILNSYVVFSEVTDSPSPESSAVRVRGGPAYEVELMDPSSVDARSREEELARKGLLNEVDIGVYISLDSGAELAIATDGFTSFVTIYSSPEDLEDILSRTRRLPISMRMSS